METYIVILILVAIATAFLVGSRFGGAKHETTSDPIADADKHMAYGMYEEAEKLVSKSLSDEPTRDDLKIKLLEVYFIWGQKSKFETAANRFKDELSISPDWEKVKIMGSQVSPENELFR